MLSNHRTNTFENALARATARLSVNEVFLILRDESIHAGGKEKV